MVRYILSLPLFFFPAYFREHANVSSLYSYFIAILIILKSRETIPKTVKAPKARLYTTNTWFPVLKVKNSIGEYLIFRRVERFINGFFLLY